MQVEDTVITVQAVAGAVLILRGPLATLTLLVLRLIVVSVRRLLRALRRLTLRVSPPSMVSSLHSSMRSKRSLTARKLTTKDMLAMQKHQAQATMERAVWRRLKNQQERGYHASFVQEWKVQDQFRRARRQSVFVSHSRAEENFLRSFTDESLTLPPAFPPERELLTLSRGGLYRLLLAPVLRAAFSDALGWAFMSGALGTGLVVALRNDNGVEWITSTQQTVGQISEEFRFFTLFLLLGCLTHFVDRWQRWLVVCHNLQSRLQDTAQLIGIAVKNPNKETVRRQLFKIYRYLNVAHALTYKSAHPFLPRTLCGYVTLGLLTTNEVQVLLPLEHNVRDAVYAWVGEQVEIMIEEGELRKEAFNSREYSHMRRASDEHDYMFVEYQPNSWLAVMRLIVDYQVFLTVVGFPFLLLQYTPTEDYADSAYSSLFQPWTVLGVYLVVSAYWAALAMAQLLSNPYSARDDSYNPDALLGSTEYSIFILLRASFDKPARDAQHSKADEVSSWLRESSKVFIPKPMSRGGKWKGAKAALEFFAADSIRPSRSRKNDDLEDSVAEPPAALARWRYALFPGCSADTADNASRSTVSQHDAHDLSAAGEGSKPSIRRAVRVLKTRSAQGLPVQSEEDCSGVAAGP